MANDYTKYPQGSDVLAILTGTGIALSSTLDTDGAAMAAEADFERRTAWRPFLAKRETRYLTPPRFGPQAGRPSSNQGGRTLELEAGLLDLPDDGLLIGFVPNTLGQIGIAQGITAGIGTPGTVLTRGIQYYLKPDDAPQKGLPWTHVVFPSPTRGIDQSIVIRNGLFGYCRVLPFDVWFAIARYAAEMLVPEVSLKLSGGLGSVDITDEKSSVKRTFSGMGAAQKSWTQQYKEMCMLLRRPSA